MMEYGLALGGGGTKGAYHIGVWSALTDMKINVTCITGTSIGAINGAVIAQGDADEAINIWKNISMDNIVDTEELGDVSQNLFDAKNILKIVSAAYKNNGLETAPLRTLLENIVDEERLRGSKINFGLTTYSLDGFEETEVFLEDIPRGQLIDYLMASSSLPGLKLTTIDEKKYIDGGVANNIPANIMIEKGYKNIICVDVGGMGVVKTLQNSGTNIINIKCSENIIGHLDFNEKNILRMMNLGYYDTLKTFEYVKGNIYNFNLSDYHRARVKYSAEIMDGIEKAAQIFGIDELKIYRFEVLKDAVVSAFKRLFDKYKVDGTLIAENKLSDKQILIKLSIYMMEKNLDPLAGKLIKGLKKNIYQAANSIVYFLDDTE